MFRFKAKSMWIGHSIESELINIFKQKVSIETFNSRENVMRINAL